MTKSYTNTQILFQYISKGLMWQKVSICWGNDLVAVRQQAITWTNDEQYL